MPELPEVHTTTQNIQDTLVGKTIVDVWTNYNSPFHVGKNNIKNPQYFSHFKKQLVGTKIKGSERMGKNILIHVSSGATLLVHMKMTGHLLYGRYKKQNNEWVPDEPENHPLHDPFNRHIRLVFTFSDKTHLALSDLRKFAKVTLLESEADKQRELSIIGPDPLSLAFTPEILKRQMIITKRPIKLALMDPKLIAGIGNIYSDEALWRAGIIPTRPPQKITDDEYKKLFKTILEVLQKGIDFGGDSMSDYRRLDGTPGEFQARHEAYRRTGEHCRKRGCGGTIVRLAMGGRGAHYCDTHQC